MFANGARIDARLEVWLLLEGSVCGVGLKPSPGVKTAAMAASTAAVLPSIDRRTAPVRDKQ